MSSFSSSFVDVTAVAVEHCEQMSKLHPDLASDYDEIQHFVTSKLWHQLTLKLLSILEDKTHSKLRTTQDGTNSFLLLYNKVILAVEKKLHPLSVARMSSAVADSLLATDGTAAKATLENLLLENKERLGTPATIYLESKLGLLQLKLLETKQVPMNLEHLKQSVLLKNKALLVELSVSSDPDGLVHSAHYETSMVYYKAVGPPESYYEMALSYLQYTSIDEMTDPAQLAVDLCLATLTGEGVFNLSQVVDTPLLQLLQNNNNTSYQWLYELLQAASMGDVQLFKELSMKKYATQISNTPALHHRTMVVLEKVTLLSLIHMITERPSNERTLSFMEIATRLNVPITSVELVIMRALSLHLLEGRMDQVEQTLSVTWVMPRVLNSSQTQDLATRFGEWAIRVSKTRDMMKEQTTTLLV